MDAYFDTLGKKKVTLFDAVMSQNPVYMWELRALISAARGLIKMGGKFNNLLLNGQVAPSKSATKPGRPETWAVISVNEKNPDAVKYEFAKARADKLFLPFDFAYRNPEIREIKKLRIELGERDNDESEAWLKSLAYKGKKQFFADSKREIFNLRQRIELESQVTSLNSQLQIARADFLADPEFQKMIQGVVNSTVHQHASQ
jgi:hypothetical protein